MKFIAKYSAFVCLSYQVNINVCNPIPLNTVPCEILDMTSNYKMTSKTDYIKPPE